MESSLDDSSSSTSEGSLTSWITWFCSLSGHEMYLQVPEDFIEDDFNLTGLDAIVPYYTQALETILDLECDDYFDHDDDPSDNEDEEVEDEVDDGFWKEVPLTKRKRQPEVQDPRVVEPYAFMLYGLIHQRYVLTKEGQKAMAERYSRGEFGKCPRYYCENTPVLPVGKYNEIGKACLYLYCPKCLDIYYPMNSLYQRIDGAHFGTTYSHLLFLTYPELVPAPSTLIYEPRLFGFKVNPLSESGPRNQWLRKFTAHTTLEKKSP